MRTAILNKNLARAAVIAVSDQAVQSAANFAASVFLIHYATKAGFGIYGVAYATLLLINSCVTAVFAVQMTYVVPHRPDAARKSFCADLLLAQSFVSIGVTALVVALTVAAWAFGLISAEEAELGCIVEIGTAFLNRQEYYRSLAYLFEVPLQSLGFSGIQVVVWAAVVLGGWWAGAQGLERFVLAGWCLGAAAANLAGRVMFPLPPSGGLRAARAATVEVLGQGIWSALGVLMTWIQNQSYAWILILLVGAESIAETNFARLFFSPLGLLLMALSRVARPSLSTVFARDGKRDAVALGRRLLIGVVVLTAAYTASVLWTDRWVIDHFASKAYGNAEIMIVVWGLVTAVQVTRWNSALLLGVFWRQRQMTSVEVYAAAAGFAASLALIMRFGAIGAVLGIGVGELVLTALMWREVNRAVAAGNSPDLPTSALGAVRHDR